MKHILFLSVMNGSPWGGSEELWYHAALATARLGYPTGVCCFDWEGKADRMQELEKAGCKLYLLPPKEDTKKQPLLGKIKLNKAVAEVPFEEYGQVIVSQGGWKDVAHGPFKKLYRRLNDFILIYHNYNVNEKFSLRKFLLLQKWADKAKKNLGDTPKIFEALEEAYSLVIPRQEKLFNPLTFPAPTTAAPYPAIDGNYIFSVFAALDTERKAQDILIKTFLEKKWQERNIELHLYGKGKDKELLQKMISEPGLDNKIFLKGNATNYQEAIRQSHLVLQITHIDAMPITVMDAMAMARPLVVSKVGDMPNWIRPGENGWVTDQVTPPSIDATLEKAWTQRADWEQMGRNSFAIFQRDFPAHPVSYFLRQCNIIA